MTEHTLTQDGHMVKDGGRRFCVADRREDAAHIVRCVNAHEMLLGLALDVANQYEDTDAPLGEQARGVLDAIAKMEATG